MNLSGNYGAKPQNKIEYDMSRCVHTTVLSANGATLAAGTSYRRQDESVHFFEERTQREIAVLAQQLANQSGQNVKVRVEDYKK